MSPLPGNGSDAQAIAGLLLEASARGTLALALAGALAVALRGRSAALRHAVWTAGLLALLAMPALMAAFPAWSVPVLPSRPATVAPSPGFPRTAVVAPGSPKQNRASSRQPLPIAEAATGLWVLGAGLSLFRWWGSSRRLRRMARGTRPAGGRLREIGLEAGFGPAAPDGAGRRHAAGIELRIGDGVPVPLASGVLRRQVLLPGEAVRWPEQILRGVLAHELAHHRRRDPLWTLLGRCTTAFFWFHPLALLGARRMRSEAESACDAAVLAAGMRASRYAETLLFVGARGSVPEPALGFARPQTLARRIERVLAREGDRRALARVEIATVLVLAGLLLPLLALGRPVSALDAASRRAGTAPPSAGGQDRRLDRWLREAGRNAPEPARAANREDSPVRIERATVRILRGLRSGTGVPRGLVTMPDLRLRNLDRARTIVAVWLELDLPTSRDRMWKRVRIEPSGEAGLEVGAWEWSNLVPEEDAGALVLRIAGVRFADGRRWGEPDEAPAAPPAPPAAGPPDREPPAAPPPATDRISRSAEARSWVPARFRNPAGAPVVIVAARTPLSPGHRSQATWLPEVTFENRTVRPVAKLRVRFKADRESHAVSGLEPRIEPGGRHVLPPRDLELPGRAEDMTVQILGVEFEDGTIWGTMDSTIHTRDAWVFPLDPGEDR